MYYSKVRNRTASLRWLKNMSFWGDNFYSYINSMNVAKKYITRFKIE